MHGKNTCIEEMIDLIRNEDMRMKFTIAYKAEWGETVHADITFFSRDGKRETLDLALNTADGYHWLAETHARQNRHHPYSAIAYYYKVVDAKGALMRRESVRSPRAYTYDANMNYIFSDFWLDDEVELTGEVSNYTVPAQWKGDEVARLPIFEQTVIFKVSAPRLHENEALGLLGNHPTLGEWNTDHYLPMIHLKGDDWVLSVNVMALESPLEYKYVVVDAETKVFKRWEYGENRTMGTGYAYGQVKENSTYTTGAPDEVRLFTNDVCVLHGGDFRVKRMSPHAQFNYDTYIFDLDGTLLSTLQDLAASCNYALKKNGMPERTLDEVRRFVGNGVKLLMIRAVPDGEKNEKFEKAYADFRQHYMMHNLDTTQPYRGVMEMLRELKDRGKQIAVVSNKFYAATQALCRHFFGDLVEVAIGEREDIRKKPAPDTVNEALRQLHAGRDGAVYIGDSDVDVMTAKNSGMPCISVLWGFRDLDFLIAHGAHIFVSTPGQIAGI